MWFPVIFIQLIDTRVLDRCGVSVMWRPSLSHGNVIAGLDGKPDPTVVGHVVMVDALTGYWQVGKENYSGWTGITL